MVLTAAPPPPQGTGPVSDPGQEGPEDGMQRGKPPPPPLTLPEAALGQRGRSRVSRPALTSPARPLLRRRHGCSWDAPRASEASSGRWRSRHRDRAQCPGPTPPGAPPPDHRRPQAAGPEAAAGRPAGLHRRLRVRGRPRALRGAGATPAEPRRRLEAAGPAGPFPAPRGGRLPALLGRRPSGPSEEEASRPSRPPAPSGRAGPHPRHCGAPSPPGGLEKGGGGGCPEGQACGRTYSRDSGPVCLFPWIPGLAPVAVRPSRADLAARVPGEAPLSGTCGGGSLSAAPFPPGEGEGAPVKVSSPGLIPRWAGLGEQVLCPTGAAEPKHNPCPCLTYHPLPTLAQPPPSALPPFPFTSPTQDPGPVQA